ncbi:MAG: hypothetical protein BLM47_03860 [Candidatus Reconcilbacillus cellulovorans]|uniref:Uncharacterized protein n=1 Tax=Candidatus Reconcilbacillus cellulovorans TaxID=1906605 RepID=A0A2A6E267_9BACL|nr:MAG: hypothetical protein BLM47_03860 [Candidatus Reconcilbacillus cellulovorans]
MTGRLLACWRPRVDGGDARQAGLEVVAPAGKEYDRLVREVRKALADRERAERRFLQAEGADQVDVAVYEWEAAEKRLDVLLKQVRRLWHGQTACDEAACGGSELS